MAHSADGSSVQCFQALGPGGAMLETSAVQPVLAWLLGPPQAWTTFMAARLRELP